MLKCLETNLAPQITESTILFKRLLSQADVWTGPGGELPVWMHCLSEYVSSAVNYAVGFKMWSRKNQSSLVWFVPIKGSKQS